MEIRVRLSTENEGEYVEDLWFEKSGKGLEESLGKMS